MSNQNIDDGSLGFLGIVPSDTYFPCDRISQQQLTNQTFWVFAKTMKPMPKVLDPNKPKPRPSMIVKIKFDINDDESKSKKFFTSAILVMSVLDQIEAMDKFPRKVTLRIRDGNIYYLE